MPAPCQGIVRCGRPRRAAGPPKLHGTRDDLATGGDDFATSAGRQEVVPRGLSHANHGPQD
jgi:hypothetical protein